MEKAIISLSVFFLWWLIFKLFNDREIFRGSSKWHFYDACLLGFAGAYVCHLHFGLTLSAIRFYGLFLSCFWLVFDILYNKIVLKQRWYYVGHTATMDQSIRHISHKTGIMPGVVSLFLKFVLIYLFVALPNIVSDIVKIFKIFYKWMI